MSTLKADTIQSTGGGAATLTKQKPAKLELNYGHAATTIYTSFNVSSVDDVQTGYHAANTSSSFSSTNEIKAYNNCQPANNNSGSADYLHTTTSSSSRPLFRHFENGTAYDATFAINVAHGDLA